MTDSTTITLTTAAQFLPGVGPIRGERLKKLGVRTVQDLLHFFPRDYEHPAPEVPIDQLKDGHPASITGIITDAELTARTPGRSMFGAVVTNETGSVRMVFFNQPFRSDTITIERRVMVTGVPKQKGMRMEFSHPKVTFLLPDEAPGAGEINPVYPLTEGFKQVHLRRMTREAIDTSVEDVIEVMPDDVRVQVADAIRESQLDLPAVAPGQGILGIQDAIRQIHFPTDDRSLQAARMRFVFQELFVMQLALAMRRRKLTTDLNAPILEPSPVIHAKILQRFGFELTGDQKAVIDEIGRDMSRQFPMNRMLQGDVGSGKTVVAIYAMMLAAAGGHQAVLMAPTEVLARQHFATLQKMTRDSQVRVGLLCGSLSSGERTEILSDAAAGKVDLVVGTQALLYGIEFKKLGLCVIDEQHKFGVNQRTSLRSGQLDPHYLVMSATPIPRSIAMTMFGDVDLSTIREKPPGRTELHTYLSQDEWKPRWWKFVKDRLAEGRQAYVVAPRVSSATTEDYERDVNDELNEATESQHEQPIGSETPGNSQGADPAEDISSVESIFAELSTDVFRDHNVALLHGRMSNDNKQAIMQAFEVGDIDVLVSTTVIEVGIDVPNATVMAIMGAHRFGLAQLHQLRGRVARGVHPGHVAVFTDGDAPPQESERLRVLESTSDGFELAEADFRLRGPGDMLGRRQSGLPPMRVADLTRDADVLSIARSLAQEIVDADPEMRGDQWQRLRQQVMRRYGQRLEIGDVA